ncbi:PQQ-dependent sugar dehydrogenase [Hansschlegelia beijingensis]|uniref:Glucose/arabinose dehydrogenase n=1 Tax=Hansschlegelia beijingensis TaxID=1133344 RepID=A0A7W6D3Q0_9HYPH|nr:PQQ-dependent sugar dehydrogenase [Hansschlegelia beijingensis]MBB3973710.1 glucose/arabinose dehydrogenase [Hansschlegelia beijingensis]
MRYQRRNALRLTLALVALTCGAAAAAEKTEEFWSLGGPKGRQGFKLAPVSAFPVPTPAEALPTAKLRVPPGFKVETYASDILDARMMRLGERDTLFVSSLFVANKVYAVVDKGGRREVKTVVSGMTLPNGIEFRNGALYVANAKEILRYDGVEDRLDAPPKPVVVYDKFPGESPHGWKFLKIGPDGKLYVPVGAPCNVCEPDPRHARIFRMDLDGSNVETVARGVRNSVGFDFDPRSGDLWFTDNQRDWISDDMPLDELNHVTRAGQDFGFPYCHSGLMTDPEFGQGRSCGEFVSPAALLGPHAAPLGMRFYTGGMFPEKYRDAIFIARHGPWNRSQKYADVAVAFLNDRREVVWVEPFLTGFVEDNEYVGRPVDVEVMRDGSLLVSDDHNGAIYRVSYVGGATD